MQKPHLTEDEIEQYAMNRLPQDLIAAAEEHLLVCAGCRDDLELIGLIIAGLREGVCR